MRPLPLKGKKHLEFFHFDQKTKQLVRTAPMKKLRITVGIIIDTDLNIPPITGVTYRLYYLSRALVKMGVRIKIFLCNRKISMYDKSDIFSDDSNIEFHLIPKDIFYHPRKMNQILSKQRLDVLQFEDAASFLIYSELVKRLGIPTCLELHDIEATLLEGLGFAKHDILVNKAATSLAASEADAVVCMTRKDRNELINEIGVDTGKLFLVPNPIDAATFHYYGPDAKSNTLLFIGNMYYWPNARAASVLVNRIFPEVQKKYSDAHLMLVGLIDPKIQKKYVAKGIECPGAVKDLSPYLKKSVLGLCPVKIGSGMKVKILNYCASGLPVITTSIGASGYEDIEGIMIEDDLSRQANTIITALSDRKRLMTLSQQMRRSIIDRFDIDKVAGQMKTIYEMATYMNVGRKSSKKRYAIPKPLWLREGRTPKRRAAKYFVVKHGVITYQ